MVQRVFSRLCVLGLVATLFLGCGMNQEWLAVGFKGTDQNEIEGWQSLGMGPKEAILWKKEGFEPNFFQKSQKNEPLEQYFISGMLVRTMVRINGLPEEWLAVGITPEELKKHEAALLLTPIELREWIDAKIDPSLIMGFLGHGFLPAEAAIVSSANINIDQIRQWKRFGFSPQEIVAWIHLGIKDANKAHELKQQNIAPENYVELKNGGLLNSWWVWGEKGFTVEQAKAWMAIGVGGGEHLGIKRAIEAGLDPHMVKPWLDAGFEIGDKSLVAWNKEGFTIAEARQWSDAFGGRHPRQTHSSDIEEMAKWKKEGFAPKEAYTWRAEGFKEPEPFSLQQVAGGPSVAKSYKEAGVAPDVAAAFSIAKVEPRQAGTEYQKIDKACGGQILKTTKLIFENPYAAKGKCYLLKGFRTQVVDRTSGLYKMGDLFTMAFFDAYILVDFEKPAPSGMNAVVKVAGTAKLDSGDVIPSAKVVWAK